MCTNKYHLINIGKQYYDIFCFITSLQNKTIKLNYIIGSTSFVRINIIVHVYKPLPM